MPTPPEDAGLRDLLVAAADRAAPVEPPVDLWRRGKRRHRLQQVVTVAALVALVGGGGVGLGPVLRSTPSPVRSDTTTPHSMTLPSQVETDLPWLPSFRKSDRGPLSMVFPTVRDTWFENPWEVMVGIAATSGTYVELNLSQRWGNGPVAISSDGRYLAYWLESKSFDPNWAGGLGIYDTLTGKSRRWKPSFRINPMALFWVSEAKSAPANQMPRLVFQYVKEKGSGENQVSAPRIWPADGDITALDGVGSRFVTPATPGSVLVGTGAQRQLVSLNGVGGERMLVPRQLQQISFDSESSMVAALVGNQNPTRLQVGDRRQAGERLRLRNVADVRVDHIFGWRDAQHVVASVDGKGVCTVNVATGRVEPLVRGVIGNTAFADDALKAPIVPAVSPRNSTTTVIAGSALLLAGLGALVWLWRRRRALG